MLLEVVLSLSIFVVAVVGLIRTLNAALDADFEQRRLTDVRLSLQNLIATTQGQSLATGVQLTEPDLFKVRYRREVSTTTLTLESGLKLDGAFLITVQALDTTRDDRVIAELTTYAVP